MNPSDQNPDPLDELLAAMPVKPSADFADRTLARLLAEESTSIPANDALEDDLDALLASQPVIASAGFADKVMAELETEAPVAETPDDNKVVGFPSWVIAIGSIAALMVLGMFSFITLFDYAAEQKAQGAGVAQSSTPKVETGAPTPAPLEVIEMPNTAPELVMVAANPSVDSAPIITDLPEVVEYENVLTLDNALEDALLLADLETLNSLQAFLN